MTGPARTLLYPEIAAAASSEHLREVGLRDVRGQGVEHAGGAAVHQVGVLIGARRQEVQEEHGAAVAQVGMGDVPGKVVRAGGYPRLALDLGKLGRGAQAGIY